MRTMLRYFIFLLFPLLACSSTNQTERKGFISLHPAITETIFYLNAQDKLVGRSTYCLNPSEAEALPVFGTSFTPNLEAIANKSPEALLADQSIGAQNSALKQITTVHELAWLSKEDIEASITELGKILQTEDAASALVQRFDLEFSISKSERDPRSVLILMLGSDMDKGQLWYIRKDSLHGTALEVAGFQNAGPEVKTTPSMSFEELILADPDIILLVGNEDIDQASTDKVIASLMRFSQIKAVQDKQIARIEMHNAIGIGPRLLELPAKIVETIALLPKI
jgi:iron complex transport system substrate-binding protein